MQYLISDSSFLRISEENGTIQNISNDVLEISNSSDFFHSFLLFPHNSCVFDSPRFIRAANRNNTNAIAFIVVPFFFNTLNNSTSETNNLSKFTNNLFADMNKYGIKIFHKNSGYLYLPNDWAIEFFIQCRKPVYDFADSPAIHFLLVDSFDMAVSLSVNNALKTNEHPSEAFYLGTLDADNHYYEPLNISLLDGLKHHVAIICQHFEGVDNDFCLFALYVDLQLVTAQMFQLDFCFFQDFSTLIFGVDAFSDFPCLDNLVTFDEILCTKNLADSHLNLPLFKLDGKVNSVLLGDWDNQGFISNTPPPVSFNSNDNSVFLYKNAVLTFFPNTDGN